MSTNPVPCDCLIFCGDDPWLQDGRSVPCATKVARDAALKLHLEEQQQRAQLLKQLGHKDTLPALLELSELRGQRGVMAKLMRALLDVVLTIEEPESDDEAALLRDLETKAVAMLAEVDQQVLKAMVAT